MSEALIPQGPQLPQGFFAVAINVLANERNSFGNPRSLYFSDLLSVTCFAPPYSFEHPPPIFLWKIGDTRRIDGLIPLSRGLGR